MVDHTPKSPEFVLQKQKSLQSFALKRNVKPIEIPNLV